VEAYVAYEVAEKSGTEVTFGWTEGGTPKTQSHLYPGRNGVDDVSWALEAGKNVQTTWVEYATR
jgi:hypothetical protein